VGILQNELIRARRERKSVSIILGDVDHFKKINDTQGHPAGDAVLKRVARQMQSGVRSYDSVGRYGGEEFLLVLPGCSSRMGTERAEQIRLTIGEPSPDSSQITVSMGVAAAQRTRNIEELLSAADAALYCAKHNGRNRVESAPEIEEPKTGTTVAPA
jgi:diguanylate cyclase (GGDEF)-like protein